ncbi:hypothetical protein M422DRAFT_66373 [Sphaerobolus stellatus SS14]|uniref:Uncharacterized protein n=1 Tax=Sphaerobolus stellatus (strain SS14) TaxID=990650 RepID=A0A0C9W5X9_SPHS4|nr:hypothetical protein M422DRAFT_66373 [Sphaerobolus stellatus SS14]
MRTALHVPTSKDWIASFSPYPFQNNLTNFLTPVTNSDGDPRNDDFLVPHFGSQLAIQNTFGDIQGFTKPPATPWFGDDGKMAGIVHQERNLTFALFEDAGHLVPQWQPARALTFGCNKNGTVLSDGLVIGGESVPLQNNILPAEHNPIFTGPDAAMGSIVWPSVTIASWDMFTATALSAPLGTAALNV